MTFIRISSALEAEQYPLWERAALTTRQVDPFCCSPDWQLSFHHAFSPLRRLWIEEAGGAAILFAETILSPEHIFLTPIEPHWFFACPLLGSNAVDMLSKALISWEQLYRPCYPKLLISGIRPGGILAQRLLRTFGCSHKMYLHSSGVQAAASLQGGYDGYLSRRSYNCRSKLKKAMLGARNSGIVFERVLPNSFESALSAYGRMLAVEEQSWKGLGQCGMTEPPAREFYAIMMQKLALRQRGRVIFAMHEGNDIGFIFGGMAGNIYRGQQFSYVADWKAYSLGNLLQAEQIQWLCDEGARRYDMGPLVGERMSYKGHWTEQEMALQTWVLIKK